MIRLPRFRFIAPSSLSEASSILRAEGSNAMLLAGGTDVLPNMKRKQQQPGVLVGLSRILVREREIRASTLVLGAGVLLADLARDQRVSESAHALWLAAAGVGTPLIRNKATLGGNLCIDTRCNYYNQSSEWRRAIDFCMKAPSASAGVYRAGDFVGGARSDEDHEGEERGSICWVAPGSRRCWAVSSTDAAPALIALGAEVELASATGMRRLPLASLYHPDGMAYLTKQPDEIVTRTFVPVGTGWKSTYWKLRRRSSIDFPVASVAAAIRLDEGGGVTDARLVLGAVASCPVSCDAVAATLQGQLLTDEAIARCAERASRLAKPLDNTDLSLGWRSRAVAALVTGALRELRGDDPATLGGLARHVRRTLPVCA